MELITESQWGRVSRQPLGKALGKSSELEKLVIEHTHCKALVSLYGGHVLSWQPVHLPKGEQDVFWLSNDSLYQEGKAIRGGIPLCWPWFGGYIDEHGNDAGNHGFARQVNWQIASVDVTEQGVTLVLEWQGQQQHQLWPYHAKVTQTLVFGENFKQTLHIDNLSSQAFEFTGALHSYFAVSHPENVTVPALEPLLFDCKLTGDKSQRDSLANIVGPLDRIYYPVSKEVKPNKLTPNKQAPKMMKIIDTGLNREVHLTSDNVNNWVLWNPGKDIAQGMTDIHSGGENEFICLEAANTDWISVPAGESASFSQTITVKHL